MTRRSASSPPPASPGVTSRRTASLADVASLAGVSSGTVSRALSKPDMISPATRDRVLAAADRLGYVANGAARALAMRRTMTVGAVVPRFGGSSFPTMIQALEITLAAEGYTLLLSAPEHQRSQEVINLRALLERGVDAVALLGAEQAPQVLEMLARHRTPFVMMWAPPSADGIGFDEQAAAALVIEHLWTLGHRHIGFIGGRTEDNERARRRVLGLTLAIATRGMTLCDDALIETDYGFREGFEAMQQIIGQASAATAIVCGNDYLAAGALSALDRAGIAVPGAMSVASFNDNDFAPYLHPPLTTVRLPIRAIGEQSGRHLLARLRGQTPAEPAVLPVQLMVRESTASAPGITAKRPSRRRRHEVA